MSETIKGEQAVKGSSEKLVRFQDDPQVIAYGYEKTSKQGHKYYAMSVLVDHITGAKLRGEVNVSARQVSGGKILVLKSWKPTAGANGIQG